MSPITREMNDARDITHNLRTAIVDANGNFVKAFTGNEWSPDELIADLERVAARSSATGLVAPARARRPGAPSRRANGGSSSGCERRSRCSAS